MPKKEKEIALNCLKMDSGSLFQMTTDAKKV